MSLNKMWIKSIVRFPVDIRRAQRMLRDRNPVDPSPGGRPIVLDIRTPQLQFDCARHLVCIAKHARLIGSPVILRTSKLLMAGISRKLLGKDLLSDANVSWCQPGTELPSNALVLTDSETATDDSIRLIVGCDVIPGTPVMPYPLFPSMIPAASEIDRQSLRQNPRHGIFFAGRMKKAYGRVAIEQQFGVLNRLNFLETVQTTFESQISDTLNEPSKPISLLDCTKTPIESSNWLATLSQFRFMLCPPGASQPICHNAIEAMCVGTIPIIEYDDRFWPNLTDGVNAICFRGKAGLIDAVHRAISMTDDQAATMRDNVLQHYQEHLRGEEFLRKLRDDQWTYDQRMISLPFHDRNFFRQPAEANKAA